MNRGESEKIEVFLGTLQHLSEHTRSAYRRDLEFLRKYCETHDVATWQMLDGRQIRGFIAQRHRQGVGGRTLQRNLSAIRAFYRFLVDSGVLKLNPAQALTKNTERGSGDTAGGNPGLRSLVHS